MKSTVVYATDENYVKLTAISLYSLLSHNPGTDIAILANDISTKSHNIFSTIVRKFGTQLRIVDVKHELQSIKATGARSYVSFSAYSRLFIPKILKNDFGETNMNEYEVFIEDINSCGGEQHAKKELLEVEADSPEAYVRENGRFPILDISKNSRGDTVIITGDGKGNFLRYTFSE